MRYVFLFLSLTLSATFLPATTYYVSTRLGSDNNSGTSPATPFQTIGKVNSVALAPGDSVLFSCGNVFRGQLIINESGAPGKPIVISKYGTGAPPCIKGSEIIDGTWTVSEGNIYKTFLEFNPWYVFVNENWHTIARSPNDNNYYNITKANLLDAHNKVIGVDELKGKQDISGSYVSIRTDGETVETRMAKSFNATTGEITLDKDRPGSATGQELGYDKGYGIILSNKLQYLDEEREFYYDSTKQTLYLETWNKTAPAGYIEGSVYDFGVQLSSVGQQYVVISGIEFRHQKTAGIFLPNNNSFITIDHCSFANLSSAIATASNSKSTSLQVSYNLVLNAFKTGMLLGNCFKAKIIGNDIETAAPLMNMSEWLNLDGSPYSSSGAGIISTATRTEFSENKIANVAHTGIAMGSNYNYVYHNEVSNCCQLFQVGTGIYSYEPNGTVFKENMIHDIKCNTKGVPNSFDETCALYLDYPELPIRDSIQLIGNTFYNSYDGIETNGFMDGAFIRKNTFYNIRHNAIEVEIQNNGMGKVTTKMQIRTNTFYCLDKNQCAISFINEKDLQNQTVDYANCDSNNYYFFANDGNYYKQLITKTKETDDISAWKNNGNDAHGTFFTKANAGPPPTERSGKNLVNDSTCSLDPKNAGWNASPNSGTNFVKLSSATDNRFDGTCLQADFTNTVGKTAESISFALTNPNANEKTILLTAGKTYALEFEATSSLAIMLNIKLLKSDDNTVLFSGETFSMGTDKKLYRFIITPTANGAKAKINFTGQFDKSFSVMLDNLKFYEVEPRVCLQTEQFPIFTNPTGQPRTLNLKSRGYKYIDGSDLPESIIIPPFSSIILRNDNPPKGNAKAVQGRG